VNQDMPLLAFDLFPGIVAIWIDVGATFFSTLHTLAVNDTGSWTGLSFELLAALHVERMMYCVQRAVIVPATQVVVHRAPRRQVLRDIPPLAAGAEHIHDAVHQRPFFVLALVSTMLGGRDQR